MGACVHFITNAWLARPESRASSSKGRRATRGQVPKLRGGACLMPSCIRYLWMVYAKLGEISTHDPIASRAFRIRQKWKTLDSPARAIAAASVSACTLAMDDGACCTRRITSIAISAACAWNGTISGGAFPSKQTRDDQSELEPARERICRDISAPRTSDCGGMKMMIYSRRNVGRLVKFFARGKGHAASSVRRFALARDMTNASGIYLHSCIWREIAL